MRSKKADHPCAARSYCSADILSVLLEEHLGPVVAEGGQDDRDQLVGLSARRS
jgi:hypothetical protein